MIIYTIIIIFPCNYLPNIICCISFARANVRQRESDFYIRTGVKRYRVVYAFSSCRITRSFGLPVGVRYTHTTAVGDDGWTCLLRERTPSSYIIIARGGGRRLRCPAPVMMRCRILYIIRADLCG